MRIIRNLQKKAVSLSLALIICISCIPLFGSVASAAENVSFVFNDPSCMNDFTYTNNLLVQYSDNEEAVMMAVAGGDPFVLFNVEGKASLSADVYKYVVVT